MILAKLENVIRLEEHEAIVKQLEAENKDLVEGLRFYADGDNKMLEVFGSDDETYGYVNEDDFSKSPFKAYNGETKECMNYGKLAREILNRLGKK